MPVQGLEDRNNDRRSNKNAFIASVSDDSYYQQFDDVFSCVGAACASAENVTLTLNGAKLCV